MDPLTVNTIINAVGLVLVAAIGAAGAVLNHRMTRLQSQTEEIDRTVKVIKIDVDGKLEQILALSARAEHAEGMHAGRIYEAASNAALAAVPQAVTTALPQIVASAEVVPTQAGDVVKVIVEGEAVE